MSGDFLLGVLGAKIFSALRKLNSVVMPMCETDHLLGLLNLRLASQTLLSAMSTRRISIRVSDRAARTYEEASEQERRKLDALLSMRLTEASRSTRPLEEIMSDLSREAKANGLTEEKLQRLLSDE